MSNDQNFDELSHRFARNIYDQPKGQIRLDILKEDLASIVKQLPDNAQVLDAGVGLGHMAVWCAEQGLQVLGCDISRQMVEATIARVEAAGLASQVSVEHCAAQAIHKKREAMESTPFQLIICHAVLEWIDEQPSFLAYLKEQLAVGGQLSLMFYNVNALIARNLYRGNFRKVASNNYRGDPGSLTPMNPLYPEEVEDWLANLGFDVELKRGVRVVYDHLPKAMREQRSYDDMLAMERQFSQQEPFRSLGRYMHIVARRVR